MEGSGFSEIIAVVCAAIGTFVPLVWYLGAKVAKIHGLVEQYSAQISGKLDSLDRDLLSIKEELRSAKVGRAEIWKEVNTLRERTTVIETKMESPYARNRNSDQNGKS